MVHRSYSNFFKKSTNLSRTILVYFKKAKQLSYKPTKKVNKILKDTTTYIKTFLFQNMGFTF